ncbi:hypothetical protein KDA_53420 [Dictyobacter alpinus]|uniref:Extracellular solute-binding protein n=1 Tax=Dictyobacter alpinus TaxID=2014873 RepID=A0A402BEN8_9CHLR|nr:extracellular solute-binding protein [Dictyobacter alpinus]GCE29858.1 hypothetical protein KDA_53420 [Dictyobacter alpinus]
MEKNEPLSLIDTTAATTHVSQPPPLSRRHFLAQSATIAGAAFGGSALLAACSNGSGPATSQPVTITVMDDRVTDDTGLSDHWIATFQKQHPLIHIKRLDFDKNRLSSMLAAGTPPDIVKTPGGPDISNLAARGAAKDLSQYFAQSSLLKESDLQPVCDLYRWDGKQQGKGPRYGMPHDWSQDTMYWADTAVFKRAGVPVPSTDKPLTFDALLDLGKRLTVRQGSKIQILRTLVFSIEFNKRTILEESHVDRPSSLRLPKQPRGP